jgi:hypothetical protein
MPPSLATSAVRLSLPSSIVLASVIISLGLYFGLRRPDAASTPAPARVEAAPKVAPAPMQSTATPPPRPALPSEEQLRAQTLAQVEAAKPRWKAACWDPADPATRKPGRYVSVLAFDAEGQLDISGVSEIRDGSDSNVGQCLRLQLNTFTISPPGRNVSFEIPFEIP